MQNTAYPIDERNAMLRRVFENLGYFVEIIGDKNQPKIVIDKSFAISGFVKNKLFNFTSKPFGGVIVKTICLSVESPLTRDEVEHLINATEKRRIWKIFIHAEDGTKLYYIKTEENIPYFSTEDNRYFFDLSKVTQTAKYLAKTCQLQIYIDSEE